MGGSLYPESLIRVHTDFLYKSIMGNTHSVSNSSKLSLKCADEARAAVLAFFKAPPEYTVIFTPNATAALKLVGESYPFIEGSHYLLCADSHNSVHGIRQFATSRGAGVCYIPSTNHGGFDPHTTKSILLRHRLAKDLPPSLFAITGQSNITNSKAPLSTIELAQSLGYHTLLDAAALAPTSSFSLTETPVDAMVISFYKMFGFPTGVGALIVKKSFLKILERPWFAGGTVEVVQVPGNIVTRSQEPHEQFEDGTINYLTLPAVTDGLRFLSAYLPFLPLRLSCLVFHMATSLSKMRHDSTRIPVVRILSRVPSRPLMSVGELSDTGSTVSLIFFDPLGQMIPNSFIEYAATKQNISLRTGCMCNPGGAAAILGIQEDMKKLYPGVTLKDFEHAVGRELGVVRISLGLGSNFQDVWNVLNFVQQLTNEEWRSGMWNQWARDGGDTILESVGQAI
ncbi:PLP-dependent transferase [Dendrothele bispora CBS 962.96]|uniref:PLP-dependent transferase n=1 Tax=Dendrothele bispora (strain CBS 962.96) TaxID=1314807 RepID=A0A4S8MU94_DENBC|nr:PLP-dependent transferase [Dendrothele bispora CBS 962.96]